MGATLTGAGWLVDEIDRSLVQYDAETQSLVSGDGTPISLGALTDPLLSGLRRTSIALAAARAGVSNATYMLLGDSTTAGFTAAYAGRTSAYPIVLSGMLNAQGAVTRTNSSVIDPTNTTLANFLTFDTRWTAGANWTLSGFSAFGVRYLGFNNATPANLTFTPSTSCDTYDLYYVSNTGYGTVTIASAGASPGTVNMNAALSIRKATITVTAGQPLTITPPVSTTVNVIAVVGYTAATNEISFVSFGIGSSAASYFAERSAVYQASYLIDAIVPQGMLICLGINDWLTGVPVATYETNLQAIVTRNDAIGCDSVLMSPFPSGIANTPLATQQQYQAAMQRVAATNGLQYIDWFTQVGSYEIGNPLGYYAAAQTVHGSAAGYNAFAQAAARGIKGLFV